MFVVDSSRLLSFAVGYIVYYQLIKFFSIFSNFFLFLRQK